MAASSVYATVLWAFPCLYLLLKSYRSCAGWRFLLRGRALMLAQSQKYPRQAFTVAVPGNTLHVVTTPEHYHDMNAAPLSSMSPWLAAREMFQPKYTVGIDWGAPREQVSLVTVRSTRHMISELPKLEDEFVRIMQNELDKAVDTKDKRQGWSQVLLWETIQRTFIRVTTHMLLGREAANDDMFLSHALAFIAETGLIMETVRLVPSFLAPIIKGRNTHQKYFFNALARSIEQRRAYTTSTSDPNQETPQSSLEAFVDFAPNDWSLQKCVDAINIMFLIIVLATPIIASHLVQDMYSHPEHLEDLRTEENHVYLSSSSSLSAQLDDLPFLEAFVMESMRTKCFQANTAHRVAVRSFTFSDGHRVPAGEAVEFNQHAHFNDPALYLDSTKFDPCRFLNKGKSIVDIGYDWSFWGVPRHICPGRLHVANTLKLLAVVILQRYDCRIENTKDMNFEWRDALVPSPHTVLSMRFASKVKHSVSSGQ
ncbi:cytochrome P450 [Lophiostoma macrostomum CBS 122681]|uniref:Cytochrome P450 n=1 Tax=Lophiostoma macrostomum CBS 122681 TaxID=1314788 RepID=A0A6A6SPC9_9PLEO|nr:cytochrome P450 [Lophiostoma macrostomum CBS 122681]